MSIATLRSAFADEIDADLDIQIRELTKHNIQGLDLRTVFGKNVMLLSNDEIKEVRTRLEGAGLHIQCIGSPINKVKSAEVTAQEELEKLKRAIELAHLAGTRHIRLFSPETPSDEWGLVRDWMGSQVELAKSADVLLLHENDARYWGAFPDQAKQLFAEFFGTNFAAAYDFANSVHIGFLAMRDWFPWLLPYLHTLHIKDASLETKKVTPAGHGDGQLLETFIFLRENGWKGPLTIEPHLEFAGDRAGFSGIDNFDLAVSALNELLEKSQA